MKRIETAAASDAQLIARLADEIWKEHYIAISGEAHVNYMLEKFQSEQVIASDIASGRMIYFLLYLNDEAAGYCGVCIEETAVYLSKLYVKKDCRQNGLSGMMLGYLKERFASKEYIHLNVNKRNAGSIAAYKKMGFEIVSALVRDIGSGFVMDDYTMRLTLR